MLKNQTKNTSKIHKNNGVIKNKNLKLILSLTFLVLFFSVVGTVLSYHYLVKPKNVSQAQLEHELDEMELQYAVLSKKFKKTQEVLDDLEERDEFVYRSFFELEPISKDARSAGYGGIDRYDKFTRLKNSELITETTKGLDMLSKRIVVQSKSLDEIVEAAKKKNEMFKHLPAIQPIANKDLKRLASGFGMRLHPILKIGKMHTGTDFAAESGTPIYATGNAVVKQASRMGGYGNVVVLDHGYGYESLYAHMSKIKAKKGQKVQRGDVIGYVGTTGLSSGAHLHYEVHKNGEKVDPINFFYNDVSPDEFKQLYEQSQKMTVSLD